MANFKFHKALGSGLLPFLLLAAAFAEVPRAAQGQSPTNPASITVVLDDNYPPYIFRDAEGHLRGILPDVWALWEHKTGVKVELKAMDWGEAKRLMQAGQADVIDTFFRTPEREQLYDFTPPYAQIEVPVFVDKDLGGIADVESLKGFTIGVKSGDAVVEQLTNHGIDSLKEYPNYEAIILAAKNQEIKVFSVDKPAAIYYLYKYGIANEFKQSFVIYTGEFHRAVQKNKPDLLNLVLSGFGKISPRENRAINQKWLGTPFQLQKSIQEWAPCLMLVATGILLLIIVNIVLRRQVHARTSELRLALKNLQQSQERIQSILKLAPVGIGVLTHRKIVEANDFLCEIAGYPRNEIIGQSTQLIYATTQEYDRVGRDFYSQIARSGSCTMEIKGRRKNAELADMILSGAPLDPTNPDDAYIFTILDITERKKADEMRVKLERRMQESQKMESLGLLAGGIAHDFNNLLAVIIGSIDLALLEIPENSPARQDILSAVTATKRAADLVQQMLAYAGKGRFIIEPVDVSTTIRETVHMLQTSISKNANLIFQLPESLPVIEADATQLRQVVMNLVINASESLENRSGTIHLTAGIMNDHPRSFAHVWPHEPLSAGPHVYFEVADTGNGIPPELIDKIFDPFFSTKFTGRGLGLAAVLGIVRGHKGAIQVESTPGKGTTFRVIFPVLPQVKPFTIQVEATPSPAEWSGSGHLLLLVDDEKSLLETGSRLLKHLGFSVLCANDGQHAINLFRAQAPRISCVILDLTMPNLDGVQTLTELRRIRSDIPVIVSSGHGEQEVAHRFAGLPLNAFIPKPYTLNGLRDALRNSLPT